MARPLVPDADTDSDDVLPRGIYKRKRKNGGVTWGARWHDANGVEHKKSASPNTKQAALKLYRRMKHQADEGQLPAEPSRLLLGDVLDHYLPQLQAERSGPAGKRDDKTRHKYWTAVLGHLRLEQITRDLLASWRARYLETKAPASTQRMASWLKAVLTRAVHDGLLTENPLRLLKGLRFQNARIRFLLEDEEAALQEACSAWLWALVYFAINTGLRRGEQFGLTWPRVNLINHVLTIPRSKNGEMRHLPTYPVEHLLEEWRRQKTSEWVFPNSTGRKPLDADNLYTRHFKPACERAGLSDLTWHDLRRTFISRLVMAGEDLRTVMELAGHKRIEMTMRYAYLAPGRTHQAMQRASNRNKNRNT